MDLRLIPHVSKSANSPSHNDQLRRHKENLFGAGWFTHEIPVLGKKEQEGCPFKEMRGWGGGEKEEEEKEVEERGRKKQGGKEGETKNTT